MPSNYSKIQPQQIQIHEFSSPSGHVNFTAGSDYVFANLAPTLTGNFNIIGNLSVNGGSISSSSSSNIFDSGSFVVNGSGNTIGGTGSVILNGTDNDVDGMYNVIVNGVDCSFETGSRRNTILAGTLCTVDNVSGCTILHDQSTLTTVNATKNNAIYISYTGGAYINSITHFEKDVKVEANSDFYLSSSSSGIFSGDINVLGDIYWDSSLIPRMSDLNSTGQALSVRLIATGQTLNSKIDILSGSLGGVQSGAVLLTGAQSIQGDKTFRDDIFIGDSSIFSATGSNANFIHLTDTATASSGELLKLVSFDSASILINADGATSGTNFATGGVNFNNAFFVAQGNSDLDLATSVFAVDFSGNARIEETIILAGSSNNSSTSIVPTGSGDARGTKGLVAYSGENLYIKSNDKWAKFGGSYDWSPTGTDTDGTFRFYEVDGYGASNELFNLSWDQGKIVQSGNSTGAIVLGKDMNFNGVRYSAVTDISGNLLLPASDTADFDRGLLVDFGNEYADIPFLQPVISGNGTLVLQTTLATTELMRWKDGVVTKSGVSTIQFPPSGYSEVLLNYCNGGTPASGYFIMRPA